MWYKSLNQALYTVISLPLFFCSTTKMVFFMDRTNSVRSIHFLLAFTHQSTVTFTHCRGTQPRKRWTMIQAVHPLSQIIFCNEWFWVVHLVPCSNLLFLIFALPCIRIFNDIQNIYNKCISSLYSAVWIGSVAP